MIPTVLSHLVVISRFFFILLILAAITGIVANMERNGDKLKWNTSDKVCFFCFKGKI